MDAWAIAASLQTLQEARRLRSDLDAAVVVTRKQAGTSLGKAARDVLQQTGLPLLRTEMGYRVAYQEAIASGMSVTAYAPSSEASREARNLLDDVLDRFAKSEAKPEPKKPAKAKDKPAKAAPKRKVAS
jgi:chromosome partitioning protein